MSANDDGSSAEEDKENAHESLGGAAGAGASRSKELPSSLVHTLPPRQPLLKRRSGGAVRQGSCGQGGLGLLNRTGAVQQQQEQQQQHNQEDQQQGGSGTGVLREQSKDASGEAENESAGKAGGGGQSVVGVQRVGMAARGAGGAKARTVLGRSFKVPRFTN